MTTSPSLQVKAFPPGAAKPFPAKKKKVVAPAATGKVPSAAPVAGGKVPVAASPSAAKVPAKKPVAAVGVKPARAVAAAPGAATAPDPMMQPESQPHEWAGDLDESGQETDPGQAFASFTGPGGEAAWLDRADDGTITGWVRDTDGSVYRYSDADAWVIDVDDATMQRTDPGSQGPAEDGMDPNADPAASDADPMADPNVDPAVDPGMTPDPDPTVVDPDADPDADPVLDPAMEDPDAVMDPTEEDPDGEEDDADEEEDQSDLFKKIRPQKKSFHLVVTPR